MELNEYIILDLEFSCGKSKDFPREIIEFGAIKVINGEVVEKFHSYCKPNNHKAKKLTKYCRKLTGITQENIDSANNFKDVFHKFVEFTGNLPLITWDIHDKKILIKSSKISGQYEEYKDVLYNHRDIREDLCNIKNIRDENNSTKFSLSKGMELLNLTFDGEIHSAVSDALNTYKIATLIYK